jgi:hypothetical protein
MTHKLITTDQAAVWLHVPVNSIEGFVNKGWLSPAVPEEPSCFDATKINQLKKRLEARHRQAKWKWSIAGAWVGLALAVWFIGRTASQEDALE